MPEIIRIEDGIIGKLAIRYIYGLTIFEDNSVPNEESALITFLRALVTTYPCAAQIGMLPLEGDDPREVFSPFHEGEDYFLTHINSYAHGDLWIEEAQPAGCFFPHFTSSFFDLKTESRRLLIDYLLGYDHPFFYLNVDEPAIAKIKMLYEHPPLHIELAAEQSISEDRARAFRKSLWSFRHQWWEEITAIVPIGLWGGTDEACMTIYSRDPANFNLLTQPLAQTCQSIRATSWYQTHKHELRWPVAEEDELPAWKVTSPLLPNIIADEKNREALRRENLRQMENNKQK